MIWNCVFVCMYVCTCVCVCVEGTRGTNSKCGLVFSKFSLTAAVFFTQEKNSLAPASQLVWCWINQQPEGFPFFFPHIKHLNDVDRILNRKDKLRNLEEIILRDHWEVWVTPGLCGISIRLKSWANQNRRQTFIQSKNLKSKKLNNRTCKSGFIYIKTGFNGIQMRK